MRKLLLLVSLIALPLRAEDSVDSQVEVHVDLQTVLETGVVQPVDGITSSGQPDDASLKVFAAAGYTTVIDLRGPNEDRGMDDFPGAVQDLGLDYVSFPMTGAEQFNFETAAELDRLLDDTNGPVLLHCGSGNRVGAILALRKSLDGASDEEAIAYGKDAGMTGLEPVIRKVLEAK